MAKVSRSMLKGIVKECLMELLSEGLSSNEDEDLNESLEFSKSLKRKSTQSNIKQKAREKRNWIEQLSSLRATVKLIDKKLIGCETEWKKLKEKRKILKACLDTIQRNRAKS